MKRRILSFMITLALCLNLCPVQALAAGGETDGGICPHHPAHTDECGYVPENPDAPCTFGCRICPVEDLIGKLPGSVSEDDRGQVQVQLSEIYALYDGLTADEQRQVDLSPCISLQDQMNRADIAPLSDDPGDSGLLHTKVLEGNMSYSSPYEISVPYEFRTNGHTFTGLDSTAIRVTGTGRLYLSGTVVSEAGAGVEVLSGGFLSITEPGTFISGITYALDIASEAEVHLTAGTYSGKSRAIRTADGNFAALLEPGYAYFDSNGSLLLPADAAGAKTIAIGQCPGHLGRTYTHTSGATTHTWTCPYCGAEETEMCTFTFGQDGNGSCGLCENTAAIDVDESGLTGLVYDGDVKAQDVSVTVTLKDGSGEELVKGADYTVAYEPRADAGEITVTVTGITFEGTFTRTYYVEQDQPGISWKAATWMVNYDSRGIPVDSASLPGITITIAASEDLSPYLEYFYRRVGDTEFTGGLPTNAGEYEVKAYIPESQNYKEAETTAYLKLTINKIPAVTTAPTAKTLTYNCEAQELVTAGVLAPGAVAEGAEIEFKLDTGGTYSTDIPTGAGVSNYNVYYRVAETENYSGVSETLVKNPDTSYSSARINHRGIKPTVELEYYTTVYTGEKKEPGVTVKDGEEVIPDSEYNVDYTDNQDVGTATVKVTNADKGNYKLTTATAAFEITPETQETLSIAGQPNTVTYGDQFTLRAEGGSGGGGVTWKITNGPDVAQVDQNSGQVTIIGHGLFTVQAAKSGATNYKDATASWSFNAAAKPVTATVTAEDKIYNGRKDAVISAVVGQGVLPGDKIEITGLTGEFSDENAGKDKRVTVTVPDNVSIEGTNSGHYAVTYSSLTVTASITPAPASVKEAPEKDNSLKYTGQPQPLVTPGEAENGDMAYSLDGIKYSLIVPTGTEAKTYTVWYKAAASDENHKDSVPVQITNAEIGANTDEPKVLCKPDVFRYDNTAKTPTVEVRDSADRIIPESEYTVTGISTSAGEVVTSAIAVDTYTVTVTDKPGGNYEFSPHATGTFKIVEADQDILSIVTEKPFNVCYGDTFRLSAVGGSGSGAVKWSIAETGSSAADIDENGVVKVTGKGRFTVQAYREAADGYSASNKASVSFDAKPKPISPTVTAEDKTYDAKTTATLRVACKAGDLVDTDELPIPEGEFETAGVGIDKRVKIITPSGEYGNYFITWPDSTTASIRKAAAELQNAPGDADQTYTGGKQPLVTAGTTVGDIGTIVYSRSQNGEYSEDIPTGTEAKTYTVWYKVEDSENYTGIPAASVKATIKKADPIISNLTASGEEGQALSEISLKDLVANVEGTFAWEDDSIIPNNGDLCNVIFTPKDTNNYNPVSIQVQVTITAKPAPGDDEPVNEPVIEPGSTPAGRPNTPSAASNTSTAPAQTATTVRNGTANTVLSAADGGRLVQEAVANQSRNVVIKPEITGNVTKTEVSIPSSAVSRLGSETDAALTVSSPIADVTISNAALGALSQAGGTVSVAAEKVEQSVVVTVAADGETVEEVPGGLTLTVPAEDAGPGTVAVLVRDDGTRETVRKSVVEDGAISIPLSGSATVEIVDNSKDFADVPPESWAAGAVDFASSHELFNGTSETTFSPDQAMSRGMLATVLYRLEGSPELALTGAFSDVSSDAWYAEGVAWAVENGIADGYGDGRFGPDENITREQFVVMLWRYAGSPEAGSQALAFADADQVSGYAQQALCWAVENGILRGEGSGMLDPQGTATRAQVAQLLKNFMENT